MRTKLFIFFLSCLILIGSEASFAHHNAEKKIIFYLNSYDFTFHNFPYSEKAISETFPADQFIIDSDFMDSKRFEPKVIKENLKQRIVSKLAERKHYDLILCSDDNALMFILENYQTLFAGTPVVFWGLDNKNIARELEQNDNVFGVVENLFIKETIEMIHILQPEVKKIIALVDDTQTGIINQQLLEQAQTTTESITISCLQSNKFTLQELQDSIARLTPDCVLLKISSYNLKNVDLNIQEQLKLIYLPSPVPVYCPNTSDIGMGFLGGYLSSPYKQAIQACQMGSNILSDKPLGSEQIVFDLAGEKILDYQVLERYGLIQRKIPENTVLFNAPSDKMDIRKDLFFLIIGFLVLSLTLLGVNIILVISKRKLTSRLKTSMHNYKTLFRQSPIPNLLIDPDTGQITDANNAAILYYGYSYNEILDLNIRDINTLPDPDFKIKLQQAKKETIRNFTFKHKLKNGVIRDVQSFTGLLEQNDKSYLLSIVVDVTERLRIEKEVLIAKQKAEESDKLKTSFLANMSHEIRTPMNSILGFSDLLINEITDPEKQKMFLQLIHSNGQHLLNLINDIIDISRIEANQLNITFKKVNINQLMDELYLEFNNLKTKENRLFNLHKKSGSTTEININTDPIRLKQILINLLGNAFKFTKEGNIEFGYKLRPDGMVQFFVKDTGIGIPAEKHDTIFSAFEQLEDAYNRNHTGAGLGLPITKSLVEKLGGQIWLMSQPGEGSRFYFTLPLSDQKLNL